jgi:hypothetical protein
MRWAGKSAKAGLYITSMGGMQEGGPECLNAGGVKKLVIYPFVKSGNAARKQLKILFVQHFHFSILSSYFEPQSSASHF